MANALFEEYERLVKTADAAFTKIRTDFREKVRCAHGCADCCHAAFGLFFVEAAYIRMRFQELDRKRRRAILNRCAKSEREIARLGKKMTGTSGEAGAGEVDLSTIRIKCPLLSDDHLCELYSARPITCRVYGIPTSSGGKAMVCPKAGFEKGYGYPAFDLGEAQRVLYDLSVRLLALKSARETASLLISVSKALATPLEDLMAGRL